MFKRLAVFAVGALVASSLGIPAAAAYEDPNGSFTMTVNKRAETNQFKTVMTVSGTYTCSANFTMTMSGINVDYAKQAQRGGVIVSGWSDGFGPLMCDGETQLWSVDVGAYLENEFGGTPATWKNGKIIVQVNGNASDGWCDDYGCYGQTVFIGTFVQRVIQIS